jgi:beta-1,4-mannooligosaccharide/beta-1,4-mannosyl-N-acetylglucosamine phosphorylase
MLLKRDESNPIISRRDIPDIQPHIVDPSAVHGPGAAKVGDRYVLLFWVQTRGRRAYPVTAWSDDGVRFEVSGTVADLGIDDSSQTTDYRIYDTRITPLDNAFVVSVAVDTDKGSKMGVVKTRDFETFEYLGEAKDTDVRNRVIFPERVGDQYLRLDRPNDIEDPAGTNTGKEVVLSTSRDLVDWRPYETTFRGRPRYWDERVGLGPPPIKTREGWLHVYYGMATHFGRSNIYQAGVILLDLAYPFRVIARSANNILEPRESFEMVGRVPNVVLPTGLVVETYDDEGFAEPGSPCRIYYGAADTCIATATTTVEQLIGACEE